MTPQEERNKRFDEKFKGFILQEPSEVYVSFDGIKSNLTSEVNLAIEQVEKWAKDTSAFEIDIPLSDLLSFLTTLKK